MKKNYYLTNNLPLITRYVNNETYQHPHPFHISSVDKRFVWLVWRIENVKTKQQMNWIVSSFSGTRISVCVHILAAFTITYMCVYLCSKQFRRNHHCLSVYSIPSHSVLYNDVMLRVIYSQLHFHNIYSPLPYILQSIDIASTTTKPQLVK